jgi:hypothetical protein
LHIVEECRKLVSKEIVVEEKNLKLYMQCSGVESCIPGTWCGGSREWLILLVVMLGTRQGKPVLPAKV